MARTLLATTLAQFMVPIVVLIVWRPDFRWGVVKVFGLNFFFVLLFAGSALLFRHAGRRPDRADTPTPALASIQPCGSGNVKVHRGSTRFMKPITA